MAPADDGGGDPGTPLITPGRAATQCRRGHGRPFVPWCRRASARRRGAAGPRRFASRRRHTPGRPRRRSGRRRPVAVRGGGTDDRVTGGAASDRRERRSAGSRLHGPEPARVRTASVRALGDARRPTRRPRSTATATGSPIRSSRRSTRSRPRGGSRSCAWGSARRSPTGPRPTTVRTDELDVYLADVGALGLSGYVATDDPHADDDSYQYRDYSAYVVVDNDFSVAQLGASGGSGGLRATAAHEFFHAVQFAYDSSEDAWLTEGTAVWMEDQVADDVNANRRWLRSSPLVHPWVPVDSSRGTERVRRVDLLAVPDGERRRARPGPDHHPARVGAGRGRPRRSEPVLRARRPAGARRPRPLARGRARHVRRVEPGAGGVLRRGLRVSARPRLPAASRERAPPDRRVVDDQAEPPGDRVRVVRSRCGNVGRDVAPAGAGRAGEAHRLGRARPDPHAIRAPCAW